MLSLHNLFPHKHLFSIPHLSVLTRKHTTVVASQFLAHDDGKRRTNSTSSSCVVRAVEKDSREFNVDPEKAKEALQKLDQQLQTLSKKQVSPPKIKASEVKIGRDEVAEEVPEVSGSFLTYLAGGLVIFTVFYNVLFYTVIMPGIDGQQSPPMTNETESEAILQ
ncbi:hypothetical protein SLA2020_502860 [Shorea laevis]